MQTLLAKSSRVLLPTHRTKRNDKLSLRICSSVNVRARDSSAATACMAVTHLRMRSIAPTPGIFQPAAMRGEPGNWTLPNGLSDDASDVSGVGASADVNRNWVIQDREKYWRGPERPLMRRLSDCKQMLERTKAVSSYSRHRADFLHVAVPKLRRGSLGKLRHQCRLVLFVRSAVKSVRSTTNESDAWSV